MILNIIGLIVGSIVLGILIKQNIVEQDVSAIELTAIIITNIVYETFLMFLMGYGLIELPRSVWLQGSLESSLLRAQMKACADFEDISEAQTSMSICVANVIRTRNEVRRRNYRHRCKRSFSWSSVFEPTTNIFKRVSNDNLYAPYDLIERSNFRKERKDDECNEHFVCRYDITPAPLYLPMLPAANLTSDGLPCVVTYAMCGNIRIYSQNARPSFDPLRAGRRSQIGKGK